MENKKGSALFSLNSIEQIPDDPTCLKATFIILDFNLSWNGDIVSKELALSASKTLNGKPLLAKYYPVTAPNTPTDHLGTHEEYESQDRYGNDVIINDTVAIGTAITDGYIMSIKDTMGNDKEVMACDYKLWYARYSDAIDLILEWYNRGIKINSSCEYYYTNFTVSNNVCYINEPLWFDGHTVLNSEVRNNYPIIEPAYDDSQLVSLSLNDKEKWNKAISQIIKNDNQSNNNNQETDIDIINKVINNQKEDKSMAEKKENFKKVCELSFDDIRTFLYGQLRGVLSDTEYDDSWITDTYETYFILSYWSSDSHKYYKVGYTKVNDESITINWENRVEVYLYQEWKEIPEVQTQLNTLNEKINELNTTNSTKDTTLTEKETTITSLNSTITTLTTEKNGLSTKFEEATNSITELSKQVNEMKPIVDTYNTEKMEQALNEKKSLYENKFKAVNAKEKFDSEEVQNLIKLTINDNEEGKNAINSLNSIIADSVVIPKAEPEDKEVREIAKSTNNLIDVNLSFEKRYGFND